MEYLSYILSPTRLAMSSEKVKAIQDWPEPHKVNDIQSFLSFANFYQCFIHEYSTIMIPLTCLTWKGIPWVFSDDCRSAFQRLKATFTSTPILTHWVPNAPIIVETDASDYAISGIISIHCADEEIWPVAFRLWMLTMPELNYIPTTRSFWLFLKPFGPGTIILKVPETLWTLSLTTKTWS